MVVLVGTWSFGARIHWQSWRFGQRAVCGIRKQLEEFEVVLWKFDFWNVKAYFCMKTKIEGMVQLTLRCTLSNSGLKVMDIVSTDGLKEWLQSPNLLTTLLKTIMLPPYPTRMAKLVIIQLSFLQLVALLMNAPTLSLSWFQKTFLTSSSRIYNNWRTRWSRSYLVFEDLGWGSGGNDKVASWGVRQRFWIMCMELQYIHQYQYFFGLQEEPHK